MSDDLSKSLDPTELPRWLFRGVKASWHAAGTGLHPKAPGQQFEHLFLRGGIIPYIVSTTVLHPRAPEDLEVILVAADFGPLSLGVVAEQYEVHRGTSI